MFSTYILILRLPDLNAFTTRPSSGATFLSSRRWISSSSSRMDLTRKTDKVDRFYAFWEDYAIQTFWRLQRGFLHLQLQAICEESLQVFMFLSGSLWTRLITCFFHPVQMKIHGMVFLSTFPCFLFSPSSFSSVDRLLPLFDRFPLPCSWKSCFELAYALKLFVTNNWALRFNSVWYRSMEVTLHERYRACNISPPTNCCVKLLKNFF